MSIYKLLALLLLCVLPIKMSVAQTKLLSTTGVWKVLVTTAKDGKRVCVAHVSDSVAERFFSIKYFKGSEQVTLHLSKSTWKIPKTATFEIYISVDQFKPWSGKAIGERNLVEIAFEGEAIRRFTQEIRLGNQMTVFFNEGNETPWSISLAGSSRVLDIFVECMRSIDRVEATQPFATRSPRTSPSATQPFASPAQPSVPQPSVAENLPPRSTSSPPGDMVY